MSVADDLVALGTQAPAVISGLARVVQKVGPVLGTVRMVVEDPAFPDVISRIRTLNEIESASSPSPIPGPTPQPNPAAGIGLKRAVPLLDAVIFARRNPWAPWAVGAGFLLLVGGIGYRIGKRAKR